jgi:hypothetical protein
MSYYPSELMSALATAGRSRPRRVIGVCAIAVALGSAAVVMANTAGNRSDRPSASTCRPGEVSHLPIPRSDDSSARRTTPVIILACGMNPSHERFDIAAFGVGQSVCAVIDMPKSRETRIVLCKPASMSWLTCRSKVVCFNPPGVVAGPDELRTEITGEVSAEVGAIQIKYSQHKAHRSKSATLGRIDQVIMKRLHIQQPGGVFVAMLPGCVPVKAIRVIAEDKSGKRLPANYISAAFAQDCTAPSGSSGEFHLTIKP